jgi:hypothetical protein
MQKDTQTGGCGCGAVRFAVTGKPKFVAICHCSDCRRYTGAVFSTFAGFLNHQVAWSGDLYATHASSPGVKRGFCPGCGTPLFYQGERWAGETHLYVGTFDDPEAVHPQGPPGEVFEHEKISWVKV